MIFLSEEENDHKCSLSLIDKWVKNKIIFILDAGYNCMFRCPDNFLCRIQILLSQERLFAVRPTFEAKVLSIGFRFIQMQPHLQSRSKQSVIVTASSRKVQGYLNVLIAVSHPHKNCFYKWKYEHFSTRLQHPVDPGEWQNISSLSENICSISQVKVNHSGKSLLNYPLVLLALYNVECRGKVVRGVSNARKELVHQLTYKVIIYPIKSVTL